MLTSTHASRMQSGTVRKNVRRMAEKIGAALRFLDFPEMKEMQHRDYAAKAAATQRPWLYTGHVSSNRTSGGCMWR